MIDLRPNPEHRYKKRSCFNCNCFICGRCHAYQEHRQSIVWCDKAKYGCRLYQGIYQDEEMCKRAQAVIK